MSEKRKIQNRRKDSDATDKTKHSANPSEPRQPPSSDNADGDTHSKVK
jgi:hypothetical protein